MQIARAQPLLRAPVRITLFWRSEAFADYLTVLPALIVISVFAVFPVAFSLGVSLFKVHQGRCQQRPQRVAAKPHLLT